MRNYYIYIFLDMSKKGPFLYNDIKLDYEPFYVGKGIGDRIVKSQMRGSLFKVRKLNKVKSGNNLLTLKLFSDLTNIEALEIEIQVIEKIGRRDLGNGPLVNQTSGGDGRLESNHTAETRLKIGSTNKVLAAERKILGLDKHTDVIIEYLKEINTAENNPMYGKTHTNTTKETQSLLVYGINHPMYNKTHTEEALSKLKNNRIVDQYKLNQLSISRNSKVVCQYTLNDIFMLEYSSIKNAAIETGISESYIGKICRGLIKSPTKFKFTFKNKEDKLLNNSFVYKIDDIMEVNGVTLTLKKRFKKSCVLVDNDGNITSLRKKDYLYLWDKKILV